MDPLLTTALRAADAAARVHLAYHRSVSAESAREKGRSDFVTKVDLEAQEAAIGVIKSRFPHHEILAEEDSGGPERETGDQGQDSGGPGEEAGDPGGFSAVEVRPAPAPGTAGSEGPPDGGFRSRGWPEDGRCLWIIDPLDGTTNFLHRHPMFAASVAVGQALAPGETDPGNPGLNLQGILEAGAVVAPRTQERWWASRGSGSWKNGRRIRVSGAPDLNRALIGTGFPFKRPELVPRHSRQLQRVLLHSGGVRRGGSAALDLCYLAEGILDGFWEEAYLSPWDTAAGLLILSEAGGRARRMDGTDIDLEDGSILAGNSPGLLEELGALLNDPA